VKSGDYLPDFEFWQRLIKERQENFIHSNLSGESRQWIGRVRALVEH
jgi:hypothetical protein